MRDSGGGGPEANAAPTGKFNLNWGHTMLKSALLWASTNPTMAQRLPRYRFVQRAVRRFMPGERMDDALREGEALAALGTPTLVTELGENVDSAAAAQRVVDEYLRLAGEVRSRGLDMQLSVKPTHLGLDQGLAGAAENVVRLAREADGIVWVDMESSPYVDPTLELVREARSRVPNVGVCLQAYLHRTEADYEALLPDIPNLRLVKGAYLEPPEVALPQKTDVDEAFRRLAVRMLRDRKAGRMGFVALGTHDPRLIREASRAARELDVPGSDWEVEMLYGIGVSEQGRLRRSDIPLRVLISYGAHWFPWYMRRLAERPANVGFVLRQMLKR
ncbi:MAG: proline dehydrogenase family protein [Gemmatimonadales bacterium]|nr:MAG: proline dehydrogenase family protein [Gemmatimonadales bacterium]